MGSTPRQRGQGIWLQGQFGFRASHAQGCALRFAGIGHDHDSLTVRIFKSCVGYVGDVALGVEPPGSAADGPGEMGESPVLAAARDFSGFEFMVTRPPQGNGPMFGRPFSSSARFQAVMDWHQLRSTSMNVLPHFTQSVK